MLDYEEIDNEISKLENGNMTMGTCEKLSVLYNVRDHKAGMAKTSQCSVVRTLQDNNTDAVREILEEHFETIKILYPKEYELLVRKISAVI